MTHHLKILPEYFEEVIAGKKPFEIRFNDRNFKVGDRVELREYLGYDEIPDCPDLWSCRALFNDELSDCLTACPIGRDSCVGYLKHNYSGRSVWAKITGVFDLSKYSPVTGDEHAFDNFVLFTFDVYRVKV